MVSDTDKAETERSSRRQLRVPVEYRARGSRGSGTLWDVSSTGARVELASEPLVEGTKLELRFLTDRGLVVIWGHVTRCTQTGFGVLFSSAQENLRALLESIVADGANDPWEPNTRAPSSRKSRAKRRPARLYAEFESSSSNGRGLVLNVSMTGAGISTAAPRPATGTKLAIQFSFPPTGWVYRIECEVVRLTKSGFAVEFHDSEERREAIASAGDFLKIGDASTTGSGRPSRP